MTKIGMSQAGSGKPLVFFHGWGFDQRIWRSLIPTLSDQYRLYFVDLPGFGDTPYMSWQAFQSGLLDALPQEFALLGWSMGGLIATRMALEEPKRVTHLINVASSPCFIVNDQWPGIKREVFSSFFDALVQQPKQTLDDFIQLQLQGTPLSFTTEKFAPVQGLRDGLELLSSCDLREQLSHLNMPVCYMFGGLDAIVSRRTLVTMRRLHPDFHYVLFDKAAHIPFLSHPDLFKEALEGCLK